MHNHIILKFHEITANSAADYKTSVISVSQLFITKVIWRQVRRKVNIMSRDNEWMETKLAADIFCYHQNWLNRKTW